jgi:hypothetical protein
MDSGPDDAGTDSTSGDLGSDNRGDLTARDTGELGVDSWDTSPDAGLVDSSGTPDAGDEGGGEVDQDSGGQRDEEPEVDADATEMMWSWTWADCRRAFLEETLDESDGALCDAYYRAPSDQYRYGLHWIFLGHDSATVETYPETQMDDLNAIYAPNDMTFFTHSRERIVDPVATEGSSGSTLHTIADLIGDIRQYLSLDETDPQAVLDVLIARLQAEGVELGSERDQLNLTLETQWRSRDLFRHIGRLHSDVVTVVVRQAAGDKSTGSYPSRDFDAPAVDIIILALTSDLSALPHEMGHFFGLVHIHGTWARLAGSTQLWQLSALSRINEVDWDTLGELAGDAYDGDFGEAYLPYDSFEEAVASFEEGQIMARRFLGWAELTYTGDFEPIASDAEFVALIRAGTPPLMKNFVRLPEGGSFAGNNCGRSYVGEDRTSLRCRYGDDEGEPLYVLTVDDAIVDGTILFGDHTESNLMSYVSTNTEDGVRRKRHLTTRQRDLIRLGSRMPSRLRLRDFSLEP